MTYKAGPKDIVLPPKADDALRQDLACEICKCRYSTIGAGYFCPACGHNSPLSDFRRTLNMTMKTIDGLDRIKQAFSEFNDADAAEDFERQWLENQIEDLVTAFQRVSESLFRRLPGAAALSWDANLFQRLADASRMWTQTCGHGYEQILEPSEISTLQIMIQRRHKIGHTQGMVDARYVQHSGDRSYDVGQRLVTGRQHVRELVAILTKLVDGLQNLAP
ncbi:MAG: hypothetical protein JNK76_03730 [Planctomycetales bacterium]|nr:hypothetical protein [Planctomycetales bacterium]